MGDVDEIALLKRAPIHKRACVHEWTSSGLVAQPEAIRLGATSVNSLLSHPPPFSTIGTSSQQRGSPFRRDSPRILVAEKGYLYPFVPAEDVLAHKTSLPQLESDQEVLVGQSQVLNETETQYERYRTARDDAEFPLSGQKPQSAVPAATQKKPIEAVVAASPGTGTCASHRARRSGHPPEIGRIATTSRLLRSAVDGAERCVRHGVTGGR
jgi:hypothetical protein